MGGRCLPLLAHCGLQLSRDSGVAPESLLVVARVDIVAESRSDGVLIGSCVAVGLCDMQCNITVNRVRSEAKRMLADRLRVKISALPRRRLRKKDSVSKARGVHQTNGRWWVRVAGDYRGCFPSEVDAMQAASAAGSQGQKRKRALSQDMVATIREVCTSFHDWVPADIEHLIEFRKENPRFALLSGPLYLLVAVGKEDRFEVPCGHDLCISCSSE